MRASIALAAFSCAACTASHTPPPTVLLLSAGAPLRIEVELDAAGEGEARLTGGGAGGGAVATGPFERSGTPQGLHGLVRIQVEEAMTDAWLTLPFVADLDGQPNDEPRLDTTRTAIAPDGLRGLYLGDLAAGEARDIDVDVVSPLGPFASRIAIGGLLRADAGPPSLQVELEDAYRTPGDGFYVSNIRPVHTGDGYAVVPAANEGSPRDATLLLPRAGRYRAYVRQIAGTGAERVDLALGTLQARLEGTTRHEWVDLGATDLPAGEATLTLSPVGDSRLGLDALALVPDGSPPPEPWGLDSTAGALDPAVAGASLPDAIASRLSGAARGSPEDLRRALRVAMSLEPLPTEVPASETVDVIDDGPCSLELLWFEGGNGPVPANLYVPDDVDDPRPAIVNPIGHWSDGKAKTVEQQRAAGLCRLGFVSLSFDTYWQGERATLLDNHFLGTFDVLSGGSFAGMVLGESVRAVSYLASRPEVDATRIGVTGASGGGMVSAYLAVIDDRIAASAPVVYTTDWEWLLLESLQGDPDQIPFGAALLAPLPDYWTTIAPRPLMFITADEDGIFPPRVARRVFERIDEGYAAAGAPGQVSLEIVPGGHGYGDAARRLAYDFFLRTLAGGGQVDELPVTPIRDGNELEVNPPGVVTLVDRHVAQVEAIRPALDRTELDGVLSVPDAAAGGARRVSPAPAVVESWAVAVDAGREISAMRYGPLPAREVVIVVADGGVAGATVAPWLVGADRAVLVVEPTGLGSQMGPYAGVSDAGFGGHGKYAGGHPFLVGLTGMAMLRSEARAAAALARTELGAERVLLCGEGLGSGGAVIAIAAADATTFDGVIGVDGFASYMSAARWARALPPALLARSIFDVGDLPDLATMLAPRSLWLVSPRDEAAAPLSNADAQQAFPDAHVVSLEDLPDAL